MGKLPDSPIEVRLAVTLFLLLMGLANLFGAWQVKNFAAFSPKGVAESVAPASHMQHQGMQMPHGEEPIDIESLNKPVHHIDTELLVQDSHVHIPVYTMISAFLSLIVLGLRLSSITRMALISLAFAAPFFDFLGLWGAHLFPASAIAFSILALAGGYGMGVVYTVVLVLSFIQFWIPRKENKNESIA